MADVQVIPRARVPVCKASFRGISFDVTVRARARVTPRSAQSASDGKWIRHGFEILGP